MQHQHPLQLTPNDLHMFWQTQLQELDNPENPDFKNHQLPLARIKKIMKSDEDVKMISAEAPVLFAKACEMFILELTLRSWIHTEENKRKTLQKTDIAMAVSKTDTFDFLIDIVPREDTIKDENLGAQRSTPLGGIPPEIQNYYFLAHHQQALQQQHQPQQSTQTQHSQQSSSSSQSQQTQPQAENVLENRSAGVLTSLPFMYQQQQQQQQLNNLRYQAQLMQQMHQLAHGQTGLGQGQTAETHHQEETSETNRDSVQHNF